MVVADNLEADVRGTIKLTRDLVGEDMIFDIGPKTTAEYSGHLGVAGTILWNGPLGVFEHPEFAHGTRHLAKAIAASRAFSVAGGGDTLAALEQFGVAESVSYISTGGGAFLKFVEGKKFPAIAVLEERA